LRTPGEGGQAGSLTVVELNPNRFGRVGAGPRRRIRSAALTALPPAIYGADMGNGVMCELEQFVEAHRNCGGMDGDADTLTGDGYRAWLACEGGAGWNGG
jgi:hypothetical protein